MGAESVLFVVFPLAVLAFFPIFACVMEEKDIALVLASGGAKGFAHIGAIEELERQGYRITSIAGASMGALVGGIYAAGGLEPVKEWMCRLTRSKVFSLADFAWSPRAILKGERLMEALQTLVPDCPIESLRIPYCAVATDMKTGEEVRFREGSLYDAIRASISIPMVFTPVEQGGRLLVDGGLTNGLPLDCVLRRPGDLLVAVNLDDYRWGGPSESEGLSSDLSGRLTRLHPVRRLRRGIQALSSNYASMLYDTISVLMKRNTEMALRLTPPDIYLNVDVGEYGSYDYDRAEEISRLGEEQMRRCLAALRG